MTVYELIQELVEYEPNAEIIFKCNDENTYDCDFRYKRWATGNELFIELN